MNTRKLSLLSIALATALAVAGCGGGGGSDESVASQEPQPPIPPPTQPKIESFTKWSLEVIGKPAEGVPEDMDNLLVEFDGNEDPNAYAVLFPPEPVT